ncbi:MAG: methyl-accepting chemotaxis protein [bacterium]
MKGRMIIVASTAVALAVAVTSVTCLYMVKQDLLRQAQSSQENRMKVLRKLLEQKGSEIQVVDGKLAFGKYVVNANYEVVDEVKRLMGGTATVFLGDTRVSTNVIKDDGSRAVGTKLQGPAYDSIFKKGEPFQGETKILGIPYFTKYEPIKDDSGKTIGVLYVGERTREFFGSFNRVKFIAGSVAILMAVLFGTLTFLMVRRMMAPLESASEVSSRFAEGDLTATMKAGAADTVEVRRIVDALGNLGERLRSTLGQVSGWSHELASAAEQLSSTATQIDEANRKVSGQTVAVASASEEMSATVAQVAKNTRGVQEGSEKALEAASLGVEVIESFLSAMTEIGKVVERAAETVEAVGSRAREIGGVAGMINEIADQTNMLALNAAIEAARAGENGRGFAVVADEVRKLAEKTQMATAQIAKAIGAVQSESLEAMEAMAKGREAVRRSAELGEQAKSAVAGIEDRVNNSSGQTREIAAATEQMSVTIRDLSSSMEGVAQAVGQNAQGVSEMVKTAGMVARKAEELRVSVGRFRIQGSPVPPGGRAVASARP